MSGEITFVVEDNKPQRLSLLETLRNRGFVAEGAGDVKTARAFIKKYRDKLDLLVLDMRLEDPDYPDKTGADLGIELLETKPGHPPEFLINSVHALLSYYQLSLKLGAAAYLDKNECSPTQLIYHILALKLRRALRRTEVSEQIRRISDTSTSPAEIVVKFCQKILARELQSVLQSPCIFLLTADDHTECCIGGGHLPEGDDPIYEVIQSLVFAEVRSLKPFVLDASRVPHQDSSQGQRILPMLDGAAFLPFSINRGLRLSLGLLRQNPKEFPLAEDPFEMMGVLAQYFKNEVLEPLLSMITQWHVKEASTEARRQQMLKSTSEFCFIVGQELLATLQQVSYAPDGQARESLFDQLKTQATVLRDSGKTLMGLNKQAEEQEEKSVPDWEPVAMAELVRETAIDSGVLLLSERLKIEGDCDVQASQEDLLIIVSNLLRWFAERPDEEGPITVQCAETEAGTELAFEDRSPRLNAPLRERLFYPFSQETAQGASFPLYLVKMLVEVKYHGKLVDQTDDLPDEVGNRFVISFPAP